MGVSESSLKRWCDRGMLQTQRTAGGHRKILVSSVVSFLRETRRELVRPEVIGLPRSLDEPAKSLSAAIEPITSALIDGDSESCQQIVFSYFLSGHAIAQICDELLAPSLSLIGARWTNGEVEIFEEHRAVEMVVRILHELRGAVAPAKKSAPVALGGTPAGDGYGLPTQMIELALLEAGWNATSLGTSLPFASLTSAIRRHEPRLFWLSVSTIADVQAFAQELVEFDKEVATLTSLFVGGRALAPNIRAELRWGRHCHKIQQLVTNASQLVADLPHSGRSSTT